MEPMDYRTWTHKDGYGVYEYNNDSLILLKDHERIVEKLKIYIEKLEQHNSPKWHK